MEPDIRIREVGDYIYVRGLTDKGWKFVNNYVSVYPGLRYGNDVIVGCDNLEAILEATCNKAIEFDYDIK